MDTKEKNREAARQPRPAREQRRRKSAADTRQKSQVKRKQEAPRQRPAQETRPARQRPAEETPRQRREAPAQSAQRSSQSASASVKRPVRREHVQFAPPQGTGPRKSAPQPTQEETAALRRQQRSQRPVRQSKPEKKNALQSFISGVRGGGGDTGADAAARAEKRRQERQARTEKQRQQAQKFDTPAVIYTQPADFNRSRLLVQLLSVTAVVAAFVLGMSVFFKVKTIQVAGTDRYSANMVEEASGISKGEGLLTFSKARAAAKIQAKLSYVDDVRIGIKLPDTVIIYVEELEVSYAMESTDGDWWLINAEGKVVDQLAPGLQGNHTQVLGVKLEKPKVGNAALAADEIPEETLTSGEPVPLTVTGAQRLAAALQILKALEANDIVGQAASVDVTALDDVTLWYGSQYEVLLGDTTRMEYKIACMNDAILQMSDYQSGILDISFTHWAEQVGYTPFG